MQMGKEDVSRRIPTIKDKYQRPKFNKPVALVHEAKDEECNVNRAIRTECESVLVILARVP